MGNIGGRITSQMNEAMEHTINVNAEFNIMQHYSFGRTLEESLSSQILEVTEILTGKKFALKVMSKTDMRVAFERETKILKLLQHPNIMAYKDSHSDSNYFYIVYELCTGGDLLDCLVDSDWCINEKRASELIGTMLLAVQHCHENHVVHRDLKPENFVFKTTDENSKICLIDFGCAKIVKDNVRYRDASVTHLYLAPEVVGGRRISRTGQIFKCSDMWSMGVIAYTMMTGQVPFYGMTAADIFNSILYDKLTFPEGTNNLSEPFQDFCKRLLMKSPHQRMTVSEALEHPWIQSRFVSPQVVPSSFCRKRSATSELVYSLGTESYVYRSRLSLYSLGSCYDLEELCKGVQV